VGVQFEIDANGILHVLARDLKTGHQVVVPMKSAVDVNDADVQKMVEESVEHAFEDLKTRRWTEAKLRALEIISAARKGMAEHGPEIDADYSTRLEAAVKGVEAALATEEAKTQAGNPDLLKSAMATLDEVTKPLADLMMDKVLEKLLRRRGLVQ
jgi:molecular chaperone DnaK (HSP70)